MQTESEQYGCRVSPIISWATTSMTGSGPERAPLPALFIGFLKVSFFSTGGGVASLLSDAWSSSKDAGWTTRFRVAPWQRVARCGLIPVTIGLITRGGTVMAHITGTGTDWQRAIATVVAAALLLGLRINPLWILIASGTAGAVGSEIHAMTRSSANYQHGNQR